MKRVVTFSVFFITILLLTNGYAQNNAGKPLVPGPQVTFVKGGPMAKVGALGQLHTEYTAAVAQGSAATFRPSNTLIRVHKGRVLIDTVASGDTGILRADLNTLGLHKAATFGRMVSGWLPIGAIAKMAALNSLQFAWPSYAITHVGLVTSQGDAAMRSDDARALFGVDGSGITVGVETKDCFAPLAMTPAPSCYWSFVPQS